MKTPKEHLVETVSDMLLAGRLNEMSNQGWDVLSVSVHPHTPKPGRPYYDGTVGFIVVLSRSIGFTWSNADGA